MKNLIKPFAVILSSAILFAQVKTTVKASKIVYVGLQVEDVEPWVKDELEKKMNIIFNDLDQEKLIINSKRIANPGCYASGAISIIRPLVEDGVLQSTTPLVIHAVSGYTGGGKEMIKHFSQPESEPFVHYGLSLKHKHLKEIVSYGLLKKIPMKQFFQRTPMIMPNPLVMEHNQRPFPVPE